MGLPEHLECLFLGEAALAGKVDRLDGSFTIRPRFRVLLGLLAYRSYRLILSPDPIDWMPSIPGDHAKSPRRGRGRRGRSGHRSCSSPAASPIHGSAPGYVSARSSTMPMFPSQRAEHPDYEWGIEGAQLVELPDGRVLLNATCFLPEGRRGNRLACSSPSPMM